MMELIEKIKADPAAKEGLDSLVHDLKSEEASTLNNNGIECQINFIVHTAGEGGSPIYNRRRLPRILDRRRTQ